MKRNPSQQANRCSILQRPPSISTKFNALQWASLRPSRNSRTQQSVLCLCSQVCITLQSMFAGAQLGPRQIWKTSCPMDCCMWSTIWWSRETRVSESPQIHSPSTVAKHTTSEGHEDSYHEDGWGYSWHCQENDWGMFFNQIFIHSLMLTIITRVWTVK